MKGLMGVRIVQIFFLIVFNQQGLNWKRDIEQVFVLFLLFGLYFLTNDYYKFSVNMFLNEFRCFVRKEEKKDNKEEERELIIIIICKQNFILQLVCSLFGFFILIFINAYVIICLFLFRFIIYIDGFLFYYFKEWYIFMVVILVFLFNFRII